MERRASVDRGSMSAVFRGKGLLSSGIRPVIAVSICLAGAACTLTSLLALVQFDQTATPQNKVPASWPGDSALPAPVDRPTMLVFVHQFCSCTAATIAELSKLPAMRRPGTRSPGITFLFSRPYRSTWPLRSPSWDAGGKLDGARVVWDIDGHEARRFGARTSGMVVMYSGQGKLLFSGGVTGSRGHQGDNYGLDQLAASIDSQQEAPRPSLVFGCALAESARPIGL